MKQVLVLAVLLVAALVGSYLTWTAEESEASPAEEVVVYRADEEDLESIAWEGEETSVLLERKEDEAGAYVWVTLTETTEVEAPEPADEPGDTDAAVGPEPAPQEEEPETPEPETTTRTVSFKGNDTADEVWASFAPLRAKRELQPGPSVTDEAFGFDDPAGTLEIVRRSGPVEIVVGGETYGARDRYARYDGRVFLLDDKDLRPLQFARTRLVDRTLHPLEARDTQKIEVRSPEGNATFVQENREDPRSAFWASADSPEQADEAAENWIGKLMRMRVQQYVGPEEAPPSLEPVFSYVVEGDRAWTVEILREEGADGRWFARSEHTRGLVELTESLASEAVADLPTVL